MLLAIGEMDDAVPGPQLVDLLVLPGEARPAEDEDDLLGGSVRVGRSRQPARIDPDAIDADADAADRIAEPLPARSHLALLPASARRRPSARRVLLRELLALRTGADLGLHLLELVVDLRLRRQLGELTVELRVAAAT